MPDFPPPRWSPALMDTSIDYDETLDKFYARNEIDHKVYLRENQAVWANTDTGEIRFDKKTWVP